MYKKKEPSFFLFSHKKFAHPKPERERESCLLFAHPKLERERRSTVDLKSPGVRREVRLREA